MTSFASIAAVLALVAQALTLLLPITAAGLTLIVCMRKGWLRKLDVPLDGGIRFGGRPLIGISKSLRSLVIYLVVATAVTGILHLVAPISGAVATVYLTNPLILGPANTLAYLAGEVVNSFVKRRLGIETSGTVKNRTAARVQAIFDNLDGVLASGLLMILVFRVQGEVLVVAFFLAIATHLSTDALMRRLRLKRQQ